MNNQISREVKMQVGLKTGLLELKPGQTIEGGNIILLSPGNWVVSHPVIIGDPAFIHEPSRKSEDVEEGILMIGDLIMETDTVQEIIEYKQKPRVLIRNGSLLQFIIQPQQYLLGKTQIDIEWELATSPVPLKTVLRVG